MTSLPIQKAQNEQPPKKASRGTKPKPGVIIGVGARNPLSFLIDDKHALRTPFAPRDLRVPLHHLHARYRSEIQCFGEYFTGVCVPDARCIVEQRTGPSCEAQSHYSLAPG